MNANHMNLSVRVSLLNLPYFQHLIPHDIYDPIPLLQSIYLKHPSSKHLNLNLHSRIPHPYPYAPCSLCSLIFLLSPAFLKEASVLFLSHALLTLLPVSFLSFSLIPKTNNQVISFRRSSEHRPFVSSD